MKNNIKLTNEIYTSYICELDRTVIWQSTYVSEYACDRPEPVTKILQTTVLGWYHGEPDDSLTEQFSLNTTTHFYSDVC